MQSGTHFQSLKGYSTLVSTLLPVYTLLLISIMTENLLWLTIIKLLSIFRSGILADCSKRLTMVDSMQLFCSSLPGNHMLPIILRGSAVPDFSQINQLHYSIVGKNRVTMPSSNAILSPVPHPMQASAITV